MAKTSWSGGFGAPKTAPPPPGMAARLLAAQAVDDVLNRRRTLDAKFEALHVMSPSSDRDASLARSIATVALRRFGGIRKALAKFMDKGMPKKAGLFEPILIAGAAQVMFMETADHAAVDLSVEAIKRDSAAAPYASLANAVLRNLARAGVGALEGVDPLDDETPLWLAQRWRQNYGEAGARAIAKANRAEPTFDLTLKGAPDEWAARLDAVPLPTGSLRLRGHTPTTALDGFGEGAWWVQDAAAALPARLLNAQPGQRALDLCAAPGGKSAQLAAAGADVVALDKSAERLKRLIANFERLNLRAEVAVADAATYVADPFDCVLLDAPCSATGTIRRHPDVAWFKRSADIAEMVLLQAKMLDRAAGLVRPGGKLAYCVCSLEPEEGENQIAQLLRRNPDMRRVPVEASEVGGLAECVTAAGDLRTLPSQLWGEDPRLSGLDGFYAARLERKG